MTKIGIDFDNTIVFYDDLFHKIATEEKLIPSNFPTSKVLIRDYLRKKNKDELFTLLQAEVYGKRILEASPAPNVDLVIKKIIDNGFDVSIISHKSLNPYKGPKYNLHEAAMLWLEKNNFFEDKVGLSKKNVFFNLTKEEKVNKIESIGCDYFIDDLPEILSLINKKTIKILYSPKNNNHQNDYLILKKWNDLIKIIDFKK